MPARRCAKECDQRYTIGENYFLDEIQERSSKTHAHFFAVVTQAWRGLPESLDGQFPTPDHLRKFCLIKAGFHDHRSIVARSKSEAIRIAAFIKPMDEFAIVAVNDCVIDVYTARSQKHRAMNRQEFAASKTAVMGILDDMLGVARGETQRAGEAA